MKISVIMACYNSSATIARSIDSFLAQDHRDRELLVMDGASKDDTRDIAGRYNSPLIKVWSERDAGIYDAMNKGLAKFSGDAFGFLNSDDCYHDRTALSRVADALETADIATGDLVFVKEHDGGVPVRIWRAEAYKPGAFAKGWSLPHPSTYARRGVYEKTGLFDPSFQSAGDYDWFLRALEINKFSHATVAGTLVDMKIGGKSTQGIGSLFRNSMELLRARQQRLGAGPIDKALFLNILRKINQLRAARS